MPPQKRPPPTSDEKGVPSTPPQTKSATQIAWRSPILKNPRPLPFPTSGGSADLVSSPTPAPASLPGPTPWRGLLLGGSVRLVTGWLSLTLAFLAPYINTLGVATRNLRNP